MNTAGIQKLFGIETAMEQTIKAAKIPIPPPFGVTVLCELRKFGLSKSDNLNPHFTIIHAPAPPRTKQIIYKIKLSTEFIASRKGAKTLRFYKLFTTLDMPSGISKEPKLISNPSLLSASLR